MISRCKDTKNNSFDEKNSQKQNSVKKIALYLQ